MIHSYSSIYTLGHKAIKDLLTVPVIVEEKIDGSQISFMRQGDTVFFRSKSAEIDPDNPQKLFEPAVRYVQSIKDKLVEGWVYRGEAVCSERHNVLKYDRPANGFVYLFDIEVGLYDYMLPSEHYATKPGKEAEAVRLGLEPVNTLLDINASKLSPVVINGLLEKESCLGGAKIEGIVIKPFYYNLFGDDKKILMAKFVSERFKEIHRKEWRGLHNPSKGDIIESLASGLATEARWQKAVQHLNENGDLEDSPRDIGKLIKEVQLDIEKEVKEEIMERLWKWCWPQLNRKVVRGLPEWYKQHLLEKQFDTNTQDKVQSSEEGDN